VPDEIMNSSTPLHCLERDVAQRVHAKVHRESCSTRRYVFGFTVIIQSEPTFLAESTHPRCSPQW
jgi:hypothetical protein